MYFYLHFLNYILVNCIPFNEIDIGFFLKILYREIFSYYL